MDDHVTTNPLKLPNRGRISAKKRVKTAFREWKFSKLCTKVHLCYKLSKPNYGGNRPDGGTTAAVSISKTLYILQILENSWKFCNMSKKSAIL